MFTPPNSRPAVRSIARAALISLAILPAAGAADTTLEYTEAAKQHLVRIAQGKIRLDPSRGGNWMLFDTARREMIIVDPKKREYTRIDEAQAESLRRSVDGVMGQVDTQIAKLPPSMQEQARQMMGQVLPDRAAKRSVSVQTTGQHGRAAGFECEVKRFLVDGKVESEVCLTAAANLKLPASDLAAVLDWQSFARSIADKASGYLDIDPRVFGDGDRIPLIYSYRGSTSRGMLARITHAQIDPGLFQVPVGFRLRQLDIPFR